MSKLTRNKEITNIFRAYDIRGVYGEDIDPQIFFKIGLAFGTFVQTNPEFNSTEHIIYVAYDIRKTSSMLTHAFLSGLLTTGLNVQFSGEPLQFGTCMFSAWKQKAFATAFITASHLPPNWNGVKFYYGSGVGFSEEDNMKIRDIFLSESFLRSDWNKIGHLVINNHKNDYIEFLKSKFKLMKQMKVVVDCGNGTSCLAAPKILEAVGLDVVPLFCDVDPLFPNRESEPNEQSLKYLSEKVKAEKADFGVGFDGDGDRAIIIDNLGRFLLPDTSGIILAKYMLEETPEFNRIIVNVECSLGMERLLSPKAVVERIKVGHTFLTAEAQKPKTLIGIESSGHMVFPMIYLFDDAMLIPLKMAEIMSRTDLKLSEVVDDLPKLNKRKVAITVPDDIKFEVINELLHRYKLEYTNIIDIDGIGISLENEWILIRASNTGPKIRITVEAETEARADELIAKFQKELDDKIKELL